MLCAANNAIYSACRFYSVNPNFKPDELQEEWLAG